MRCCSLAKNGPRSLFQSLAAKQNEQRTTAFQSVTTGYAIAVSSTCARQPSTAQLLGLV
jgi:hypothetical protein